MLLMGGLVEDFNFAARIDGQPGIFSTQMYLPMPPARTSLANFFSPLVNNVEQMYLTGKETYPLERTLLTTGLTAAGVESLFRQQAQVRDTAPRHRVSGPEGVDLLENLNEKDRHRRDGLSLPLARAAYR